MKSRKIKGVSLPELLIGVVILISVFGFGFRALASLTTGTVTQEIFDHVEHAFDLASNEVWKEASTNFMVMNTTPSLLTIDGSGDDAWARVKVYRTVGAIDSA